jgi:hypothetical protein
LVAGGSPASPESSYAGFNRTKASSTTVGGSIFDGGDLIASDHDQHWDAFVSHASEDKEAFVRPLVEALGRLGVSLWYDDAVLRLGDRLSASIDRGLTRSRIGIVVISPAFCSRGKNWPKAELSTLLTRQVEGEIRLIPVWYNVNRPEVAAFSSLLADLVALRVSGLSATDVALRLLAEIRPDIYQEKGRTSLEKLASGQAFEELEAQLRELHDKVSDHDLLCPTCGSPLQTRVLALDDEDPNQDDVAEFECGRVTGGRSPRLCPLDPRYPPFDDYAVRCESVDSKVWSCFAFPKTAVAKRHTLFSTTGFSEREARDLLIQQYNAGLPVEKRVPVQE